MAFGPATAKGAAHSRLTRSNDPYSPCYSAHGLPGHSGYRKSAGWVDIEFRPFDAEREFSKKSSKWTLNEILSVATQSYTRLGTDVYNVLNSDTNDDPRSINSVYAQQLSASINIMGKTTIKSTEYNALTGQPLIVKEDPTANLRVWTISPHFETIVLDFAQTAPASATFGYPHDSELGGNTLPLSETTVIGSSFARRGLWQGTYGVLPSPSDGLWLGIQSSITSSARPDVHDTTKTGSLAQLVGFNEGWTKTGQPRRNNTKVLREAVVAIPFKRVYDGNGAFVPEFFEIDMTTFNKTKEAIAKHETANEAQVPKSVYDMLTKMGRYVFPPKFDFLTYPFTVEKLSLGTDEGKQAGQGSTILVDEGIPPFSMYIFEFEHKLSRKDVTDIWQNLPPDIGTSFEYSRATVSHELLENELMGEIPTSELHWMVFKVKQRAKTNYFEKTATSADDNKYQFQFKKGSDKAVPEYSYNWPYDYFSLVELVKMDGQVRYGKINPPSPELFFDSMKKLKETTLDEEA